MAPLFLFSRATLLSKKLANVNLVLLYLLCIVSHCPPPPCLAGTVMSPEQPETR